MTFSVESRVDGASTATRRVRRSALWFATILALGAMPANAQTGWTLRATSGPPARDLHAMAYDSARSRVVLFGGETYGPTYFGDTWEWDGTSWTQRAVSGPSPRLGHAMAYDSARGRVVLFGGYDDSYLGDTWEWDGTTWIQRASSGPAPRWQYAMAYDATRSRVVLFGGYNGSTDFGDTWEWDGTAWTQRASSGPSPRGEHAMAYDAARGRVVLFGGYGGSYLGDTWEWDGTTWTQRVPCGPAPRLWHAMAYDAARGRAVLFGGYNGPDLGDTWEWDGTSWTLWGTTGPAPRRLGVMAYDAARGSIVLFGGYDGSADFGDTWEYDGIVGQCGLDSFACNDDIPCTDDSCDPAAGCVHATARCGPLEIVSPNGGETLETGSAAAIQWWAPTTAVTFDLHYSIDNGATWKPIARGVKATCYAWPVPDSRNNKPKTKVRVTAYNGSHARVGRVVSKAPSTIEVVKLRTPNGGEDLASGTQVTIAWTTHATMGSVEKVTLQYTLDGRSWKSIATLTSNEGLYDWTVPAVTALKAKCKVRVILLDSADQSLGKDLSDGAFTMRP